MSPAGAIYLDTSAAFKLVAQEPESDELREFVHSFAHPTSSQLLRIELRRAVARMHDPRGGLLARTEEVLQNIDLLALDGELQNLAANLIPATLRSLDAIHLATALAVPELEGMVVYDKRLVEAAAGHGLRVFAPGVTST